MRALAVLAAAALTTGLSATALAQSQPNPPARAASAATAYADWTTYHNDRGRSGVSTTMSPVSGAPRVVAAKNLDGAIYASPLVVGGHTIVATENNTVYGLTSAGSQLWKVHLGAPSPTSERQCGNIDPSGITGTPVYSPGYNVLYVAAQLGGPPRHILAAIDPSTGKLKWTRSLDLPGVDAKAMQERGALTLDGASVWVPFGGQAGDCGAYKGRLVGIRADGTGSALAYTVPTAREAGIWTPPGPSIDSSGYMYVAVGNGASGRGDPYDLSDSVLKFDSTAKLVSSFSPTTWPTDNEADLDLGSQGPAIVGNWIFSAGKSGTAYVLRRSALGGIGGQVSQAALCKSFGGTAVVGSVVYVPCTDGLRAVQIDSAGTMHVLWHAAANITGSPVVGGGRIWSLDPAAGQLYVLNPATGATTAHLHVGVTSRFATPTLYGRTVLIGNVTGLVVLRVS